MSAEMISFEVRGVPAPQGSARGFVVGGKVHITTANRGLAAWRRLVSDVAQQHAPSSLWEGPLAVTLMFYVPKPKSAPKKLRTWPERRPDLDKLVRACLDSLTGIVWRDDAQVVRLEAEKEYGTPGVVVWVERVKEEAEESTWDDADVGSG
ncbi:MAG: RusA family crossover junction endodeoxyribonuclease [Thermoplasmata archaeon]